MSSKTEEKPKEEPKKAPPVGPHDCIICSPKENCKHEVPLQKIVKPLVRGNSGVEDLFKKINEVVDWLQETTLELTAKNKSKK